MYGFIFSNNSFFKYTHMKIVVVWEILANISRGVKLELLVVYVDQNTLEFRESNISYVEHGACMLTRKIERCII